ncbi:MAG: Dna2/Cas4 domain-containing protein, partial [Candidatus Hadarchaeales archaeon]
KIDTCLRLKDGELVPVDVKYTDYCLPTLARRKQVIAYALLLESEFKRSVRRAILYFLPARKAAELRIGSEDKEMLRRDLEKIRKMLETDSLPPKASKEKCGYCEVRKYCL